MRTRFSLFIFIFIISSVFAQSDLQNYKMAGPYEVVARDGQYAYTKGGSERDMRRAFDDATAATITKDKSERARVTGEALSIINAYADKLQRFDGHDAPLCLIQAFDLVRAMTILKDSVSKELVSSWQAVILRAMIPTIAKFDSDSPYANGNWGTIVNRARMVCAIFLEDKEMYQKSVDYYLYANDNGSLPRYVSETGQCQESGRDQAHVQLGLEALCQTAEMAWTQGDDLWGAYDNRLMKGIEYCAAYNTGNDNLPFVQWKDCTGLYDHWTEPGAMSRGKLWNIYMLPYYHYVKRQGLKMPKTAEVLKIRKDKVPALQQPLHTTPVAVWRGIGTDAGEVKAPGVTEGKRLHQLFSYSAPEGAPLKDDYEVYVKAISDQEFTRVPTFMARVNALQPDGSHKVSEISYSFVDFTGVIQVKVISKKRKFATARVRPDYRGTICNINNDSTCNFILFQPENVSVEFDGNITSNLLFFTGKPPVSKEKAEQQAKVEGRTFKYYAPGFYNQEDTIYIGSNTTVYLEPGSYFTGTFAINDAENVSILGRGIARPPRGYEGAHVYRSKNVLIDGLVLNTCPIGESQDVTLHDVRSISHPAWGDGLNVFGGCSDILFDRVFCRNSDDCTTAYATRKGFHGSTRNVTMRNSTLWADVAHPIFIGLHGNSERGDTIENLRYENIDILGQAEQQVDYQGCLAINCSDNNLVRDVVFDNIRIEDIAYGSIAQVKVSYNQKYCTAPGRSVENINFRNIRYNGNTPNGVSLISGYDDERRVRNVTFEGLKVNGRVLHDKMPGKPGWYKTADYVPMYVGNHVENVIFSADGRSTMVSQSLDYCSSQVDKALQALRPYDFTMMPRNILQRETTWNLRPSKAEEWCSGFWPGILWMDFGFNRSEAVRKAAEGYTEAIVPIISQPVYDHDLGFIVISSLLKGYEQTKSEQYKQLALRAADSLATLFNPTVGTILSWPRHVKDYGGHITIMDNMMNLELLFWAAENGGSQQLKDMAIKHAETTMRHHFRKDGSCYHVAVYNPDTGKFVKGVTHQGYSDGSMWSRGQSWAIYGYTMVYRFTHDKRFLDFAQKVTDVYLKRLRQTSDDNIPLWDMDAPDDVKDVSAACVVASALLELSEYVAGDKGTSYRDFAVKTLQQLNSEKYQSRDRNVSFLLHSTGHHPAGTEIDASIVYADYYYLEALTRIH